MDTVVKFYQTGTFTVGNRLLPPGQRTVQAKVERTNSLNSGHRACQGCGEALGARYAIDAAMNATHGKLIAANATGCLEVFSTPYPETSWQIPWIHSLFGNAAAVGTGIAAAMPVKGRDDVRVVAQGGDGGTTDIGFGCLSGMFERNDDVLYICYDNEAYMNTGVQRSSATPPAARTATTMAVGPHPGNTFGQGKKSFVHNHAYHSCPNKARFIGQVMAGTVTDRETGDIGADELQYAEVKALSSGNPLLLELAQAEQDLNRYRRLEPDAEHHSGHQGEHRDHQRPPEGDGTEAAGEGDGPAVGTGPA